MPSSCMRHIVKIVLFGLLFLAEDSLSSSYSVSGEWQLSLQPNTDCNQRFLCTPDNEIWTPSRKIPYYDHALGCDLLAKRGIKKIFFHGDSFMRQIYSAMLITLSGNFVNGSLLNDPSSSGCEYQRQFNEKKCGTRQLNHNGIVCNGSVLLDPVLNGLDNLNECSQAHGTAILWSFANYRTTKNGRHGVNNATAYQELFQHSICPKIPLIPNPNCSVNWISTHYRLKGHFPDEQPEIIQTYNEEMREYFSNNKCGHVNYIDVYNMTKDLGKYHTLQAEKMTYDFVHWGMEPNLHKAQIILDALLGSA